MNPRLICGIVIVSILIGSVAARALLSGSENEGATSQAESTTDAPDGSGSLVPNGTSKPVPVNASSEKESSSPVADALPFVTEASFFAMTGFALGFATRKVLKVAMFGFAGFFVALQGLVYLQVVTVDWDRAIELANDFILNLKENRSVREVLTDRIPTAGSLLAGYFIGFRRG